MISGCSLGQFFEYFHHIIEPIRPNIEIMKNVDCQPKFSAKRTMIGGVDADPNASAVEVIPLGSAQDPEGNHLAITPPAIAGNKGP